MITDRDIEKLKTVFATKENLNRFATKDELKQTSIDIISMIEKVFNDYTERIEKRFDAIDKKLVEITTWKPIILNHEERIQNLEKTNTNNKDKIPN